MIRTRAKINDRVRILVPNMDTLAVLPSGTKLEVIGYFPDQPHCALVDVISIPEKPTTYHIIVPRGSDVEIHHE